MIQLKIGFDIAISFGWILTYTLVFIGSRKYKFPLIPLSTQLIIASVEIAIFLDFVGEGYTFFSYPFLSYMYWSIIEIAIIHLNFLQRDIAKKQRKIYCTALILMIVVMCCLLKLENGMLYFSYFNTMIGLIFWLHYTFEKKYPINSFTFCLFIIKFLSDIFGVVVYYNKLDIIVDCLSIALPCIDVLFIVLWLYRCFNKDKYDAFYDKYEKYLPKIELYVPEKKKSTYGKMNKRKTRKK